MENYEYLGKTHRVSLPLTFDDLDTAKFVLNKLKHDPKSVLYVSPYLKSSGSTFDIVTRKINF